MYENLANRQPKVPSGDLEIRQSNELTLSNQDFTLTQMRLKYRIIQHLQGIFSGIPLCGGPVDPSLIRQYTLIVPLSSVDMDNHYDRVRKAAHTVRLHLFYKQQHILLPCQRLRTHSKHGVLRLRQPVLCL